MRSLLRHLTRRSPLHFYFRRRTHARSCAPRTEETGYPEVLDTLIRDGVVVLPGYLDPETTSRIWDEVTPLLYRLRDGGEVPGARTFSYPEFACFHLDEVERHSPSSRSFSDDPMILSVVAAYGGGQGVPFNTRAELRSEPLKNELVDDLHSDTWKFRFKAMLYLTEVTEDTSPFRYLAGSHLDEHWPLARFAYDFLGEFSPGHPRVERIRLREAYRRFEDPRFRKMLCTGPAGTVILFDARGLHSATTLQRGQRVVLNRTFILESDRPTP